MNTSRKMQKNMAERTKRMEQKQRRGARGWLGYAAAACLCLVVVGSILWQVFKPMSAKAFEIENGVLLAYHGTDAEVIIPDEVTKISASAFAAAPSPDSITSVTLGANVEVIDPLTFAGTKNLDTITVPEENKNFYYREGVLLAADGSLAIDTARAYEDSMDIFVDVISDMTDGENIFGDTVSFVFGKAKITVLVEENPAFATGEDFRAFLCYITAIDFNGTHLELKNSVPMMANSMWDFYQTDDMLIYTNINKSGYGEEYLLAAGKVTDISNPQIRDYNDSIYFYGVDDTGNIVYQRQPSKYVYDNETIFDLLFCAGADELFREEGIVTWDGENLGYVPTATYTVGEVWDLEQKFEELKKSMAYFNSTFGYPPCETVEELLEYNKEHYARWK